MQAELNFKNGKAIVKKGRKIIAKIYDRKVFFAGTPLENCFNKYPFCLELSCGIRECKTLDEAVSVMTEYI